MPFVFNSVNSLAEFLRLNISQNLQRLIKNHLNNIQIGQISN